MSEEVLVERRGAAGCLTLNRPQALNAITLTMVRIIQKALDDWRDDPAVTRIVLTGAGGKAFCAGGDIRALYEQGKAGQQAEALIFWKEEYLLNIAISHYPKPYISLLDGIVMGGGVGISVHGSHRVAGEGYVFAMPEVSIGFFPDVGATYFLPRMPGETGTYTALTGNRLRQGDALATGLATHAVASSRMAALAEALCEERPVDDILADFAMTPAPESGLMGHRGSINRCFAFDTVENILASLDRDARALDSWSEATAKTIRSKSPTSLKLALEQVRRGKGLTLEEAMRLEWRIVSRICHGHDFYEGVRAVIVDKDNAPRWNPLELSAILPRHIDAFFDPLSNELPIGDIRT